uniref:Outer membrane protein beta-barrel domain-containing protein n=1 Tax=Sphingobacterium sp. (strain 21) TaxID=743722 RepID=F4C1Y0_SPHS2
MFGTFLNLILLLTAINLSAQVYPAARYCAMGGTGNALQGVEGLTSNVAGIGSMTASRAGIYHQEHFLNTDIRTQGLLLAVPTKLGVFGSHISNYGIKDAYSELKANLSYAKRFGPQLSIGLALNYHQLQLREYGKNQAFSADVGLQFQVKPFWVIGARVANPGYASYNYSAYSVIPVIIGVGTSYQFHPNLLITADSEKVLYRDKVDFRTGLEYKPISWMSFRGGIGLNEFSQFCGFGFVYHKMILDLATVIHHRLGLSPQLLLAYAF